MLNKKASADTSTYKKPVIDDNALCRQNSSITGTVGEDVTCTNKSLPRTSVVVYRDSFATALKPYLNNTFGQVRYFWRYSITAEDLDYISQHADIIILEHVERSANLLVPLQFPQG